MISVRLQGGLGNQMFQYAAGRALAEARDVALLLDLSWFNQDFDEKTSPRHYELSCFRLDEDVLKKPKSIIQKAQLRIATKYCEPHFHYDPSFSKLPSNTVLEGYFQSEQYFKHIRSRLVEDFSWARLPDGRNVRLLDEISANKSAISLHVRRGDYVSNKNYAKFHGVTGLDYYLSAVKYVGERVAKPTFYIFSDEPRWCKNNLKLKHKTIYVSHNKDGSEDMRLMKACSHNIIANSSFSWWAAWLNENPDKIVVAPGRWFSHPGSNTQDLIPSVWHKL